MGRYTKFPIDQIVEYRHQFRTDIALWLTMPTRTGLTRSICQRILANTVHHDTSYSPSLLTKRQVIWLAKYIREKEVDMSSFTMTREELAEWMDTIPQRQRETTRKGREVEQQKRTAARVEKLKDRLHTASIEREQKEREKQARLAIRAAEKQSKIALSEEQETRKLLRDKAAAIQPYKNPLVWWTP